MNDVPALRRLIGETLELARVYRMAEASCLPRSHAGDLRAHRGQVRRRPAPLHRDCPPHAWKRLTARCTPASSSLALAAVLAVAGTLAESTHAAQALLDVYGPFARRSARLAFPSASRPRRPAASARQPRDPPRLLLHSLPTFLPRWPSSRSTTRRRRGALRDLLPHRDGPPAGATSLRWLCARSRTHSASWPCCWTAMTRRPTTSTGRPPSLSCGVRPIGSPRRARPLRRSRASLHDRLAASHS